MYLIYMALICITTSILNLYQDGECQWPSSACEWNMLVRLFICFISMTAIQGMPSWTSFIDFITVDIIFFVMALALPIYLTSEYLVEGKTDELVVGLILELTILIILFVCLFLTRYIYQCNYVKKTKVQVFPAAPHRLTLGIDQEKQKIKKNEM